MTLKKRKQTKEEKAAENFFKVDEDDLKNTTTKEQKKELPLAQTVKKTTTKETNNYNPRETSSRGGIQKEYTSVKRSDLETIESQPTKKKYSRKKTTRKKITKSKISKAKKTTVKEVNFTPPKILLKKNGYELIITEKPQAALKIASALGKATKRDFKKVPYYEVDRNGKKIIVACAVGHLFTLKQQNPGTFVPSFDIVWVPNYMARKKDFTKSYYDTLLSLAKNAGEITVATDYDVEGEVIGLNIVRYICNQKNANRMKFSTLTEKELNNAYENKFPSLSWGQGIAGETRHYLDWFYGINLSRALMNAIKTTGKFKIMSIGRVQGPSLKLIVDKEKEIQKFKSKDYWQVFIRVKKISKSLELKYVKDIFDKTELEKFEDIIGQTANAQTKKTQNILPPNPPFNLTTLQTESYKFFGISPANTLKAAQSLYLAGLISYPRTSSQKLPKQINYKEILKKVAPKFNAKHLLTRETPIEGKKTDPAHPSIHPTGNFGILSGYEEKVFDLIAKRFISLFCDDAIIDKKRVTATTKENLLFSANGTEIAKKAWLEIYPYKFKELEIPDMNGEVTIIDKRVEKKETQPPKRFSPASIISELEKRNLGTKATRSSILETLYNRGYVKESSIQATALGIALIESLEKYSPVIIDEKLTRSFEKEMEKITESKKDFEQKEKKVVNKAKETIKEIATQFEKSEKEIGKELIDATQKLQEQERKENILTSCPVCKKGSLAITYSKKTRKHFVACNNYPECKTTYSLPPNGTIKKLKDKVCEKCGFPLLMSVQKGKKPWIFCFNKNCETNKERLEAYYKKKEEEENKN